MEPIGKILIVGGAVMIVFGLAASGKLGPLGKLPGDIMIERENFKFYFPLATSILISAILSAILWFFRK
jgi:hypothetical protein